MKPRARALTAALLAALFAVAPAPSATAAETAVPDRIVAVGDVHGSLEDFHRILEVAGLVDKSGAWIGGGAMLVQTGDLVDRGPNVRGVLDFMRQLERSAAEHGGRLVSLLGNHEVYNLIGYFDYQATPITVYREIAAAFADGRSEKTRKEAYREWVSWARRYPGCGPVSPPPTRDLWMLVYPPGFIEYREALSPRGEYGQWLRQRDVIARVGDTLFVHGGLSPELIQQGLTSVDAVNARAREDLAQYDRDREFLENEGVALPFSTVGEVHCAIAQEIATAQPGVDGAPDLLRGRQLQAIRDRLPGGGDWLLLRENGPVWFRGYATWTEEEAETELPTIFNAFGGRRIVVGHTPSAGQILARFDGRVFLIDTAMVYKDLLQARAAALEIRPDGVFALYDGERLPLAADSEQVPSSADGNEPSAAANERTEKGSQNP